MVTIVLSGDARISESGYFSGSAGANQGRVALDLKGFPSGDLFRRGGTIPGTIRLTSAGKTAVAEYVSGEAASHVVIVVHDDDAGTWHGAGVGLVTERQLSVSRHPREKFFASSTSGAADYVVGVWVLGNEPLVIITSGYKGRRDWMVVTIKLDGTIRRLPRDTYLAENTASEVL